MFITTSFCLALQNWKSETGNTHEQTDSYGAAVRLASSGVLVQLCITSSNWTHLQQSCSRAMVSEAKWSWHIMWKCHWVPQFTLHHQTSPQTGCIHQLCVPQVSQGTNHNSESNMKFSKQCTTVKKITGLCKPFTRELRKWAGLNPASLKLNTGRASSANRYHFCYNY